MAKNNAFTTDSKLTDSGSFSKVFAKPAYAGKMPWFSVLAAQNTQPKARLGIVVAKRNVKLAVDRNKLKRLVRESFRQQQQQLNGLDVVVVIKKNFEFADIQGVNLSKMLQQVSRVMH